MSSTKLTPRAEPDELESQLLKSLLAARDIACPVCRYNLRAIVSANCPECGAILDLRVGSADLRMGAWLIALVAVAIGLGFTSIMAVIYAWIAALYDVDALRAMLVMAAASALLGVGLWELIAHRRKFWQRRLPAQRFAAAAYAVTSCGLVVLALYLLFVVN